MKLILPQRYDGTITIEADEPVLGLAVHRTPRTQRLALPWTITHIKSCSPVAHLRTKEDALNFCYDLSGLADWTDTEAQLLKQHRDLPARVADARRKYA